MTERLWTELNPVQADGRACVVCGCSFLLPGSVAHPVGRSHTGSQVFACAGGCAAPDACSHARVYRAADSGVTHLGALLPRAPATRIRTPAELQARFLATVAAHLAAYPELVPVHISPEQRPDLQVYTTCAVTAAGELAAWFASLGATQLLVHCRDSRAYVYTQADLGGYPVRVWGTAPGLQRLLVEGGPPAGPDRGLSLSVAELAHYAEHGSLPERRAER